MNPLGRGHHHHPTGGITAAGKAPVAGDTVTASDGFGRASSRIESAGRQDIRPTSKEFLLGGLGKWPTHQLCTVQRA